MNKSLLSLKIVAHIVIAFVLFGVSVYLFDIEPGFTFTHVWLSLLSSFAAGSIIKYD